MSRANGLTLGFSQGRKRMVRATVSGSFHRHMLPIYEAVHDLEALGVDVLSPADPRIVDQIGDFVFVASDKLRSVRLVQDRHLAAIRASDFLWLVCPDGYVGQSACMELGAALAARVPVYATTSPLDITISQYVTRVASLVEVVSRARRIEVSETRRQGILLDPSGAIEGMHRNLDKLKSTLLGNEGNGREDAENIFDNLKREFS